MHLKQVENDLLIHCPICGNPHVYLLSTVVARLESEGVTLNFECASGHEFSSKISNDDGGATIKTIQE